MMHALRSNLVQFPVVHIERRFSDPVPEGAFFGKGLADSTVRELMEQFQKPLNEQMYRDRAILYVALRTALRAQELVQLQWSKTVETPEGDTVFRFVGKGSKVRYAAPGLEALTHVREYHERFPGRSDYLFLSMPDRSRSNQRHPLSTRGLKRSWQRGTRLLVQAAGFIPMLSGTQVSRKQTDSGGSILAQKLAGHSSPVTTSKCYTRPFVDASSVLTWKPDLPRSAPCMWPPEVLDPVSAQDF